jgi:hypothetical protein
MRKGGIEARGDGGREVSQAGEQRMVLNLGDEALVAGNLIITVQ